MPENKNIYNAPLFSIITVCFNPGKSICATLKSVSEQTCDDYEHIIIDGLSTDGTDKVVAQWSTSRTYFRSEKDNGIYDAMNKGLGRADGKYLIFLNAGDSFHSADTLQRYANAIKKNNTPGIVYGQTVLVDSDRRTIGDRHLSAPENLNLQSFKHGMLVCHQAFCVLRRIAPLYDLQWHFSADYEWCIKCLQHSRCNVMIDGDEPAIDYLSEGMTTKNRRASLIERYKIMCHYYGTLPTLARHFSFIPRFFRNKLKNR